MHKVVYTFPTMAHAIGSATISFGLVSIPVKLHSVAETSENISFNLLHAGCGSRLKQQYVCSTDGERVERTEMAKGYEFAKGQYVVFSEEELKAIEARATQSIDVVEFVPMSEVDPIMFDKAYYLSPSKGGERAYRLIIEAMRQTGRCAIARYAARGKDYVVCLRPVEDAVVMQQMHYASEIRSTRDLDIPTAQLDPREIDMAIKVAEFASSDKFDASAYRDESKGRLRELIEKKIAGEEITMAPGEAPRAQVVDLMEALRASLSEVSAKRSRPAAATARIPVKTRERKPARPAPRVKSASKARGTRGGKAST
jgi:DNA end-binding protein Ku